MKLGLGTVQFGLDYGISNETGKTSLQEVKNILAVAAQNNLRIIDTAALYGKSEEALGQAWPINYSFDIVTKTCSFSAFDTISKEAVFNLENSFIKSLKLLKLNNIYGFLFHNANDLLKPNASVLYQSVINFKKEGLVKKVGASIYTSREIDFLLDNFEVDLIQLPINILDQRLIQSRHLKKLKQNNVEIHARSAFLQGLLLMDPNSLPVYFNNVKNQLLKYHNYLNENQLTMVEAAIGFVMGIEEIDTVICGVNNHQQLQEICSRAKPLPSKEFSNFAFTDETILNPSMWKL